MLVFICIGAFVSFVVGVPVLAYIMLRRSMHPGGTGTLQLQVIVQPCSTLCTRTNTRKYARAQARMHHHARICIRMYPPSRTIRTGEATEARLLGRVLLLGMHHIHAQGRARDPRGPVMGAGDQAALCPRRAELLSGVAGLSSLPCFSFLPLAPSSPLPLHFLPCLGARPPQHSAIRVNLEHGRAGCPCLFFSYHFI